jgi:hypothetical protein
MSEPCYSGGRLWLCRCAPAAPPRTCRQAAFGTPPPPTAPYSTQPGRPRTLGRRPPAAPPLNQRRPPETAPFKTPGTWTRPRMRMSTAPRSPWPVSKRPPPVSRSRSPVRLGGRGWAEGGWIDWRGLVAAAGQGARGQGARRAGGLRLCVKTPPLGVTRGLMGDGGGPSWPSGACQTLTLPTPPALQAPLTMRQTSVSCDAPAGMWPTGLPCGPPAPT